MTQYKYYFKKPKAEIAKDILTTLATAGAITVVASSSPFFIINVLRALKREKRYHRKSAYSTFYRLKKEGCFRMKKKNRQIYISLTEKGRKKAGRFQINHLAIKKPKRWDDKWRIILFDVEEKHRSKREALRGFLKRLNLYQIQKSVWIHPYDCRDEINLLRDFFGLLHRELRLIVSNDIGHDKEIRAYFNL